MKIVYLRFFITILISLITIPLISAPVTIEETKFHCTILKDGKLEVLYTIIFTEHEHIDRIRFRGKFPQPMTIIESSAANGMENISSFRYDAYHSACVSGF